jgi:hypothetical protein
VRKSKEKQSDKKKVTKNKDRQNDENQRQTK